MGTSLLAFGTPTTELEGLNLMSIMNFPLQLAGPMSPDFFPTTPTQRAQKFDLGVQMVVQVLDGSGLAVNVRPAIRKILIIKPSGVSVENDAALFTNGFDGKMFIGSTPFTAGNVGFDQAGHWFIQGKVTIGGNTQYTSWGSFLIAPNLGA